MGLARLLTSKTFNRLTGLSMIGRAGIELLRGDRRMAALLAGAAALAFRSSWAAILAEVVIRVYRRKNRTRSPAGT